MNEEEGRQKIQELLGEVRSILDVVSDIAYDINLPYVDFLDGRINFGVLLNGSWAKGKTDPEYISAVGGPRLGDYWSASHFHCWPDDKQREWLYGPDRDRWPKTGYEED